MKSKRSLAEMPSEIERLFKEKELITGKPLVFAVADMNEQCEFYPHFLLLCDDKLIVAVSAEEELLERSGMKYNAKNLSIVEYPLGELSSPYIDGFVVGGLLRVNVGGCQKAICAFTNTYKNHIFRLKEVLDSLLNKEEINPQRLEEEIYEEFCPKCGMLYPDKDRKVCPKCTDKRTLFFRLSACFNEHRKSIIAIGVLCILSAVVNSVWPLLNGNLLYDNVLAKNKENSVLELLPLNDFAVFLLLLVLAMVGVKILQQLFGILQGRIVARIVPDVIAKLKQKVFASIQYLSVSFFTGKETGGLMTRITSDANNVTGIFIDGLPYILPNLFTIIFSCAVMFSLNVPLAIVAIISLPPAVIVSVKLEPVLWHYNSKKFHSSRDFRAKLNDNLTGARVVRAFGKEKFEKARLSGANKNLAEAQMNSVNFDVKYSALYHIAKSLSSVLTFALGACFVLSIFKPQITYGTLLTFTGYVSLLAGPADFFSYIFRWWSNSMNSAQRIFEILDAKPDVAEKPNAVRVRNIKGDITLNGVTFGYEENREVLHDISLHIDAGKMLGIVGKSGAGKSTLANLITRLYDPNMGSILLDNNDLRDMAFEDIRKNIALVSQETYIFKGTVFENIAYANQAASRRDVLAAAMAASAHDFICKLPDGYDTYVGSGGRNLSGGERQRISIARAILSDPKILILDEATAAVDTETEKNIQTALKELVKNRTTLSIAHRLSTLRDADELIVIEDGKITERGTHMELMLKKGEYYKLYQIQSKALAMRGIGD